MLHIFGIGDSAWTSVETRYTAPTRTLSAQDLKEKKEYNQEIFEISSSLSYFE